MSYEIFDGVEVRCPKLGHQLKFGYCRSSEGGLPCSRAIKCFESRIPATRYFQNILEEKTFQRIFESKDEDRVSKILRLASEIQAEE